MYTLVYVHLNSNWIIYSYGGLFRLGYYILNLSQVESGWIISRWGSASNSTYLPDSATSTLGAERRDVTLPWLMSVHLELPKTANVPKAKLRY